MATTRTTSNPVVASLGIYFFLVTTSEGYNRVVASPGSVTLLELNYWYTMLSRQPLL